jgi:hypothetical protein
MGDNAMNTNDMPRQTFATGPDSECPPAEPDAGEGEGLAEVIVGHRRIPMYGHIPGLQRCSGGCSDLLAESDGPNSPRHALHVAEQILASDWLAAHVAQVKAEALLEAAHDIRARRREFMRLNADDQYLMALDDAFGLVANRMRDCEGTR